MTIPRPCAPWCGAAKDLPDKLQEKLADQLLDTGGIEGRLQAMADALLFFTTEAEGYCRWIETRRGNRGVQARLTAAPLDISDQLKETVLDRLKTIIVTSATLTVGGEFSYLKKRTGFGLLPKERLTELQLASPFDYARQVFVAVPEEMPEPTAPGYREALENHILQGGDDLTRRRLYPVHLLRSAEPRLPVSVTGAGTSGADLAQTGGNRTPCPADAVPQGGECRAVRHRFVLGGG